MRAAALGRRRASRVPGEDERRCVRFASRDDAPSGDERVFPSRAERRRARREEPTRSARAERDSRFARGSLARVFRRRASGRGRSARTRRRDPPPRRASARRGDRRRRGGRERRRVPIRVAIRVAIVHADAARPNGGAHAVVIRRVRRRGSRRRARRSSRDVRRLGSDRPARLQVAAPVRVVRFVRFVPGRARRVRNRHGARQRVVRVSPLGGGEAHARLPRDARRALRRAGGGGRRPRRRARRRTRLDEAPRRRGVHPGARAPPARRARRRRRRGARRARRARVRAAERTGWCSRTNTNRGMFRPVRVRRRRRTSV